MTDSEVDIHVPTIVSNGKGIRRLETLGMREPLQNVSDRRRFFSNIPPDHFERLLFGINALTRKESVKKTV